MIFDIIINNLVCFYVLVIYLTDNSHYASKAEELLQIWFLNNNNTHMNPNLQQAEMKRDVEGGTASGIC